MPNHVHVLITPIGAQTLPDIVHNWKSFTAKKANALLNEQGSFWAPEYFLGVCGCVAKSGRDARAPRSSALSQRQHPTTTSQKTLRVDVDGQ